MWLQELAIYLKFCLLYSLTAVLEEVYRRLGVTIIERGESFYQSLMPEVVKDLEAKSMPLHLITSCPLD